ncbi:MAG: TetR/AcrR family transcriptional regulator [Bacteroidia bacterium]|nr:TetR/AcrR family transcriptional regulator [Bacteroidia bacterium]
MNNLLANIKIAINENLFVKDPNSSDLGKKIIHHSVIMIEEIGFEAFTFRKLGQKIDSPEASIYRYFESKNQLLAYLISWYWGWMEYRLVFETANIASAEKRLEKSIAIISNEMKENMIVDDISIKKLHRIVICESSKSYLTKDVDKANKEGAYLNYKQFVSRIVLIIKEINSGYKYPNMLLSTIIEGAHLQVFFAEHLPRLTNVQKTEDYVAKFYTELALKAIKK